MRFCILLKTILQRERNSEKKTCAGHTQHFWVEGWHPPRPPPMALWLWYEPLLLISSQIIQLNPKQFCSYLEKSFFSRNRYCLERGDANELSSGPDGSGNLLICHTHCLHRSSSTSLSWKPTKKGRKPELGSIKCYRNLWILLLSS